MGISHSEPEETGEFIRAARLLTSGELPPEQVQEWRDESVARLLDHAYDIVRLELMSGDQEVLRQAIGRFCQVVTLKNFEEESYEHIRCTALRALFMRNGRKYETAKILSEEVLKPARKSGWNDLVYDALITLGDVAVQQGTPPVAREHYEEAHEVAERRSDEIGAARALLNRSALDQSSGRPVDAARYGKLAFEHFLEAGASKLAGWALLQESQAHNILGDYEQAFETADRALNLFEVLNTKHGMAVALSNVGLSRHLQKDFASARQAYRRSLDIMLQYDLGDADTVELYDAILDIDLGKLGQATARLEALAERLSESGRLPHLLVARAALVSSCVMTRQYDAATEHLAHANNLAARTGFYELLVVRQIRLAGRRLDANGEHLRESLEELADVQSSGLLGNQA